MIDNVAFLIDNLVNASTITPSEVNAQFPVSNLKDVRRTKVYRSLTNSASIVFDFGEAKKCQVACLVGSGQSALKLELETCLVELSNLSDFSVTTFSDSMTLDANFGFGMVEIPDSVDDSRYARITMSRDSGIIELSKIYLGEYITLGVQGFEYPLSFRQSNNVSIQKNRLGQRFIDLVNKQKELSGSISTLTKNEIDDVFEILDGVSNTKPLWLIFPEGNITNNNNRLNGYYYLEAEPPLSFDRGNYWSLNLSLEEAT